MEGLTIHEQPSLREPALVTAFAGWPDAHQGATRAVRYLVRQLKAQRFAEIDPELYYDFTQVRPMTAVNEEGERTVTWPANEFYYLHSDALPRDFVFFVGVEPNLRWRSFTSAMVEVAEQCGVNITICLGSLLDAVPHTRDTRLSGSASDRHLREALAALGAPNSAYQGPTGITTALMEACQRRGIPYSSIWGHSPHYLESTYNPKVSFALLTKLGQLLGIEFDLESLGSAGVSFQQDVQKALANDIELNAYIRRLEQDYDAVFKPQAPPEMPSAESIVQGLEEFLRRQRQQEQGEPSSE